MEAEQEKPFDPESLCLKCGRCCHRKELVHGKTVFTKDECPNLVKDERGKCSCKIYDKRLQTIVTINGHDVRCVSAENSYQTGLLPADCPYVYFYKNGMDAKLRSFITFQELCETQDWTMVYPRPKKNCNHCYGRGYIGRDVNRNVYIQCGCMK